MKSTRPSTARRLALITVFWGLTNCAAQADEIDDFLLAKMAAKNIPGLQIAVVKNNKIVKLENYGTANIQDSVAVQNNTVFTINSMTKGFTGIAVMQLVEQGKIELTGKISEYISDLPKTWENVTVKQLLTHTSGLPDIMGNGVSIIADKDAKAAWQAVKQKPLEFIANTEFRYNQTNYLLLGKIINNVSGQSFSEYIKDHQLRKVGMKRTESAGFAHFEDVIPHQARGYTYDITGELTTVYAQFPPFLRATAGMSSNAKEIAMWSIALQKGALFNKATSLATLWSPAVLNNGNTVGFGHVLNGYALGWQVMDRKTHPAVASIGGNRSALVIYPKDNLSIVVLTNLMGAAPEEFIDEVASFYLSDMQSINGIAVAAKVLEQYVGKFVFSDFTIDVSLDGNQLSMLASGAGQKPFFIFAQSQIEFFAKAIAAKFSFQLDKNGAVKFLLLHQNGQVYKGKKAI